MTERVCTHDSKPLVSTKISYKICPADSFLFLVDGHFAFANGDLKEVIRHRDDVKAVRLLILLHPHHKILALRVFTHLRVVEREGLCI
jgi:hypothetical protein